MNEASSDAMKTIALANSSVLADVGADEVGLGTERAQLLDERLAGVIAPTGDAHFRALLGEGDSVGPPDAGESAGNQNNRRIHD